MRPVALITGASSGIGETFARQLAARGYDLILVARRVDRLAQMPGTALQADLTTEAGLAKVEQAIRDCPRLELLVNNAGFGTLGRFWEADLAGQEAMHRLHVVATVRLCHAALNQMQGKRLQFNPMHINRMQFNPTTTGGIINVSSVAAFSSSPGNASYCATKAWMNSFTEGLAADLRSANSPLRVQALCPGFTKTEFHQTMGVGRSHIPNFLWLNADDVVAASLHGFDRGQIIVVPGWIYKMAVIVLRCLPLTLRRKLTRPLLDKNP